MHSALKKEGKALYDYARAGLSVEREPRVVTVHRLDVLSWMGDELCIEACVSKGTYIRTLAEDLGKLLGCGAHLSALRRVQSGPLNVREAIAMEAFLALDDAARDALVMPPDVLISDWPRVNLPADEAGRFLSGLRAAVWRWPTPRRCASMARRPGRSWAPPISVQVRVDPQPPLEPVGSGRRCCNHWPH